MTSLRSLRSLVGRAPGLVHALSIPDLASLVRSPGPDPRVQTRACAEALHRAWLLRAPDSETRALRATLWAALEEQDEVEAGALAAFRTRVESGARRCDASGGAGPLWETLDAWLRDWAASAGALLLIPRHPELRPCAPAIVTPFAIDFAAAGASPVVGWDRRPWPELEEVLSGAATLASRQRLRMLRLSASDVGELSPASAALPMALALEAPASAPLRWLATGAIEVGRLRRVGDGPAKAELARQLGAQLLLLPAGTLPGGFAAEGLELVSLEAGEAEDALEDARLHLQRRRLGPAVPRDLTERRLRRVFYGLRYGSRSSAESLRELEGLRRAFEERGDLEARSARLEIDSLRASCLCHLGRSAQARELLASCQAEARAQRDDRLYSEAVVHHIVALTDLGAYEEGRAVGEAHLSWLDEARMPEREHITQRMQCRGSLGQLEMHAGLRDSERAAPARAHLEAALGCARELCDPSQPGDDLLRDLNYLALWRAYFAVDEAPGFIASIREDMRRAPAVPESSVRHLRRIALLAHERAGLQGARLEGPIPELPDEGGEAWVSAVSRRSLGALQAAAGAYESAEANFREGLATLTESSPLLDLLAFTIALRGWACLRELRPEAARELREAARERFRRAEAALPEALLGMWRGWPTRAPEDLPWLQFPY